MSLATSSPQAIVIGASAGAIEALNVVLPFLPSDYPIPIAIVVHLPADRKSILADLYSAHCKMAVREVEDKENIERGTIYFAPPDYHLLINAKGYFSLSIDDPVCFSRPAIDVLFESAADVYQEKLVGIVLTGASTDGALGLKAIAAAGGSCIVQDPAEAPSPTLPQAALKACPIARTMMLQEIRTYLSDLGRPR